jgi:trk system potassium uptake protein TrkA
MKDAIVVAIERDKRLLTQDLQKIEIQRGELVYLFIAEESIKEVCDLFDKDRLNMIENCVIFGAGELGVDIAQTLVERKRVVKIVDRDIALCQQAQESLAGRVEVINSKYNKDENLFIEEGLDQADIFISTYKNDEYNIIKCLEAKEFGVKKVLAINNESEYYNLMHRLGIVAVRGAKMSAYNTMIERINSSNIIVEKHFCGGKGVIYLRRIFANSKLIGVRIFKPKIEGVKLFFIREDMIENSDEIILQEGDVIVALCGVEVASKTKLWIYEL